jgi:hypothetical protein
MSSDNPTPKPTIDDRIEAVVQTLELVAAMQRDNEKRLADSDQRWTERAAQWDQRFEKVMNGLERLTHVAESHERRLSDLEGQQQ